MQKFDFEDSWQEINCLLPLYDKQGVNCTLIKLSPEKEFVDKRTIKSSLKALARSFAIDLEALRKKYGDLVNRKTSIPLPLHPELILVPVKTREPQWTDHGAWGYLVREKIAAYNPDSKHSEKTSITFTDGSKLTVLRSTKSVKSLLNDARILENVYRSHLEGTRKKECIFPFCCTLKKNGTNNVT